MKEARHLTRDIQKLWNKEGPTLLKSLFNIIGREHNRKELTVYTMACEFGAMSSPLLMSVRRQLKTVRKNRLQLGIQSKLLCMSSYTTIYRQVLITDDHPY